MSGRRESAGVYPFLWRFFRRYVAWGAVALVGSLLFAAGTVALVSLVEPVFSEVLLSDYRAPGLPAAAAEEPQEPGSAAGLEGKADLTSHLQDAYHSLKRHWGIDRREVVWFVPVLFLLIFLLRSLAHFANGYAFQRIGLGATTDLRNALYRRILEQSSRFYAEHPSGELVSRVVSDVGVMQAAISTRLLDVFQQPLTLLVLLWFLLSIHLELALVCLVATPVLLYPIVRFGKGMRRTSHRSQEHMADLANLVGEGVRGHRVVKAFNMEEFEYRRFQVASRRHLRVNLRAQVLSNASSPVVESLAVIGAALLLIYAGRRIHAGELTASEFVTFLLTLLLMYDPVRKLNKVNLILQQAVAAAQRVHSLMELPVDVVERPGAGSLQRVERGIAYQGVSFSYETEPVLRDIDLEIHGGEIVALVGPSGAGKTSLVNLLPRYFDPTEGRLTLDGVDLRDLSLAGLRSLIGIVTQETVLFNDSIRNNIAYGRADLPLERVREAAAAAYADEFIAQLPHGYDTVIGEGGLKLSGGQRQRLAIARAILKDAPILILDEATSQLDSESEALVQKALSNLTRGRTTLVIAHRLSTVINADRIVVLDGGRVVEQGTHHQLLDAGGVYKRLYDLQFQG
ncbi:MAG TPA: ABC transporter ATP-binding protein [Thermoanaerobaculia bacterium]|nr:ABC transporter ATP-binding protein [Thermoanaerobaculia bacterium]